MSAHGSNRRTDERSRRSSVPIAFLRNCGPVVNLLGSSTIDVHGVGNGLDRLESV